MPCAGVLSQEELSEYLSDYGYSDSEVESLLMSLDQDNSSSVSKDEFTRGFSKIKLYERSKGGTSAKVVKLLPCIVVCRCSYISFPRAVSAFKG